MKSSEVSIKTRSTPASLSFKGQATKHTTVKLMVYSCFPPNPLYGLEYELQTLGPQAFDMTSLFEIALHSSMGIFP